ncbi:MAG: bifunctional hydroxymethylpyrimidine kinase/phosphomethylpyrimidine kinase, partial [Planctomycetota bacterium]
QVFGMSAVTAITAQNTVELKSIHAVPVGIIIDQILAVFEDIGVDAVKTGMLLSEEIVCAVSGTLERLKPPHLVVDPVMIAKSGAELLDRQARSAVVKHLLPLAEVITPNLPEAEALLNWPVRTVDDMQEAARAIHGLGPRNVVLKGGHLSGEITDILFDGKEITTFKSPRIDSKDTHGTGCTLGSAIAACLALGTNVREAVAVAREFVMHAISEAPRLGAGAGPLNHCIRPVRQVREKGDQ